MLGRTAERAYQRANRTSGADKNRYMKTYNDAYRTGGKSANKHLGGSRKHFDNGRDYEHEKWADEHNGNVTESKTMNRKLIRLTESDLHKIVKESVGKILKEGYYDDLHDYWGQEDEPNLICPYCKSDNVQEVRGKDGSWDGSCRCYDCGEVFDIDSARGNNYFEPDLDAMRHESLERNSKILKESDLHKIVKESVNRVMKEGVEFSSEDPQKEWMYYQYKLQQEFDELGIMVLNKIPRNDPDRQIIQRYIRMIQTHLHTLEN